MFGEKRKNNQNVTDGNIITENVTRSFIKTHDNSVAVVIGVNDLIIIKERDALLVAKRLPENIKDILDNIKEKQKRSLTFGSIVYRPWGSFESIKSEKVFGKNFKKLIQEVRFLYNITKKDRSTG